MGMVCGWPAATEQISWLIQATVLSGLLLPQGIVFLHMPVMQ